MPTTFRIKDWDKHFENHESRKVKGVRWVALPNKHDGKSYRRLTALPDAPGVFAAWTLILQVASKMPVRGVLADEDGPLDSDDLSAMTGFPSEIFDQAFKALTQPKIAWLEEVSEESEAGTSPGTSRHFPALPGTTGKSALEGKGTEGKERTPNGDGEAPPKPPDLIWGLGRQMLVKGGMSDRNAGVLLGDLAKKHSKEKLAQAIATTSAANPADPQSYLIKVLKKPPNENGKSPPVVTGNDIDKMQRERSQKARTG
jgi:hypothetical protein